MSVPELNSGQVYIVTLLPLRGSSSRHLGDYRTMAEALACAHRAGAVGTGSHLKTPAGDSIFIAREFLDPLLRR